MIMYIIYELQENNDLLDDLEKLEIYEMFSGNSSKVIAAKFVKGMALNYTIFNQLAISKGTHISIQDALEDFKEVIYELSIQDESTFKVIHPDTKQEFDLRQMSFAELRANLPSESYSGSKAFASLFYGMDKKRFDKRFRTFAKLLFPHAKSKTDYSILFQESHVTSAVESMASPIRDMLTSLYVREHNFIPVKGGGFRVADRGVMSKDRSMINNIAIYKIADAIHTAYNKGDISFIKIKDGIAQMAQVLYNIAITEARVPGVSSFNNVANQIMTVSQYLDNTTYEGMDHSLSLVGKLGMTRSSQEKLVLENFAVSFASQMASIIKRNPASINFTNGLRKKDSSELSNYKSSKKNRLRARLFGSGTSYKPIVIDRIARINPKQKYEIRENKGNLTFTVRKEGVVYPVFTFVKKGSSYGIEMNSTFDTNDTAKYINDALASIGFYTTQNEIVCMLENSEAYLASTEKSLKRNDYKDFMGLFTMGMLSGAQLGAQGQHLMNVIENAVGTDASMPITDALKGALQDRVSRLWDSVYGTDSVESAKKSIAKAVENLKKSINDNNVFENKYYTDNILPIINMIEETVPHYKALLMQFKGESYINNDAQLQNVSDEDVSTSAKITITPSPLNFDIGFNTMFDISSDIKMGNQTENRKNGTKASIHVQGGNSSEALELFVGTRTNKRDGLITLRNKLYSHSITAGRTSSMLYNSLMPVGMDTPILEIAAMFHASELEYYGRGVTDMEPGDILNGELTAFATGILNGEAYVPRSPFGDNNQLYLLELDGDMGNFLKSAVKATLKGKKVNRDDSLLIQPLMEGIYDMLKNHMMTYHAKHVSSVLNTLDAAMAALVQHNMQKAASGQSGVLELISFIKSFRSKVEPYAAAGTNAMENAKNYNFDEVIENIYSVFDKLNKVFGKNTYNILEQNGAKSVSDIMMEGDKLVPGYALSFNTRRNEEGITSVLDYAYNGKRMYKSGLRMEQEALGAIESSTLESERNKSFLEFNPQNVGEATDMLWEMFGIEMNKYQEKIWKLIRTNELNDTVKQLFNETTDSNNTGVVIKSLGRSEIETYNYGMLYYYMLSHLANVNLGHAVYGHTTDYGTNENLYTRSKMFETPGHGMIASEHGLGDTFKAAVLQDAELEVAVQQFNLITGTKKEVKEIAIITDGSTINPALGRIYMYRSMGGNIGPMTSNIAWKPVYAEHNMFADETTIIKDSNLAITPEHVLHHDSHVAIEYAAMRQLDAKIADQFLKDFTELTTRAKDRQRRDVAFMTALNKAVDAIQERRIVDPNFINNLVVTLTHPSSMKIGRRRTNPTSINNISSLGQLNTVELRTDKLRMVFNPDSEVENSRGEVIMKQGFNLAMSILNSDTASSIENAWALAILKSMETKYHMNSNGRVTTGNTMRSIMERATTKARLGMENTIKVGTSVELLSLSRTMPKLLQFANVNTKVKQSLNKMLTEASARLRFTGTSYNQITDVNFRVIDATVTMPNGSKSTYTVTHHGRDILIARFGEENVKLSEERQLKAMEPRIENGKITGAYHGEVMAQTVNMHKFGIVPGKHYMMDLMFVEIQTKDGIETIDLMDIEEDGTYNGKNIMENITNSLLLELNGPMQFKNALEKINAFKKSLYLQLYRKPTSLLTSGGKFLVIDFVSDNSIITSSKKIAWDDSSFNIDRLYGYEYTITESQTEEGISIEYAMNVVLEGMEHAFDVLAVQGDLHTTISAKPLEKLGRENYVSVNGVAHGLYSSMKSREQNYEGIKSIGRYVNVLTSSAMLGKIAKMDLKEKALLFNTNYKGGFEFSKSIVKEMINTKNYSHIVRVAILLQAAIDNSKKATLSNTGLSRHGTNEIVAMLYAGIPLDQIVRFMTSPFVESIYQEIKANVQMTTRGKLSTTFMVLAKKAFQYSGGKSYVFETISKDENKVIQERALKAVHDNALFAKYNKDVQEVEAKDLTEEKKAELLKLAVGIKESKERSSIAEQEAYYLLQQYAMAGEVFKRLTFLTDVMDGQKAEEYEQDKLVRMIESAFGKPFEKIQFSENGINAELLKHDQASVDRILEWDKYNNDFYLRLDKDMKPAHELLVGTMQNMFKFANMFKVMPLMRTHALVHQYRERILEDSINIHEKTVEAFRKELMAKLGIGVATNKSRFYAIKSALESTMLSEALSSFARVHPLFRDGIDMSIVEIDDDGSIKEDSSNVGYSGDYKIDITKAIGGRSRYIKRIPSYMMSFGEIMRLYNESEGNEKLSLAQTLEERYHISDIEAMEASMQKYNGDNFFNYVTVMGENYNQLLVIRDSQQIKENMNMFGHIQELFNALPSNIKDMLGVYELIINEMLVRKSSFYDFLGTHIFTELSEYIPDPRQLLDSEASRNTIIENIALSEGVLYVEQREDNNTLIDELKERFERTGQEFIYIKIRTKDKYNNKTEVVKRIDKADLEQGEDFDRMGVMVWNNAIANSLPHSKSEKMVSVDRAMKNLNEKQIADLLKKGRARIELYRGHNYSESDMIIDGVSHITYMTNAGVRVRIVSISDSGITIQKVGNDTQASPNIIESVEKRIGTRGVSVETKISEVKSINETLHDYWSPEGNYYVSKDGKQKRLRVTSILNASNDIQTIHRSNYYSSYPDNVKIALSDGIVTDELMKVLTPLILKYNMFEYLQADIMIAEEQGGSKVVDAVVNAIKNSYQEIRTVHPLTEHLNNDAMLRKIAMEYIRGIVYSPQMKSLLGIVRPKDDIVVQSVSDVMVHKKYGDMEAQGSIDNMIVHRRRGELMHTIIDFNTYAADVKGLESESMQKGMEQVRAYSDMAMSTYGTLAAHHIVLKFKKLTLFVKESRARMENGKFKIDRVKDMVYLKHEEHKGKEMKDTRRTIQETLEVIRTEIASEIQSDVLSETKQDVNEANETNCK